MSTLTATTLVSRHSKTPSSASTTQTLINDDTPSTSRTATPNEHQHDQGVKCPVTGQAHGFCPAQKTDSRSPCPALNALANHGYLPRNGQHIHVGQLIKALREGYNLTLPLASFLAVAACMLLGQFRSISLYDLSRHNLIEHDASVVHADATPGSEYAPTQVMRSLVTRLIRTIGHERTDRMTLDDIANIRVNREAETHVLDKMHAEIARGELTIALGVLGGKSAYEDGADIGAFREWLVEERFPEGWRPDHKQGLWGTYRATRRVDNKMQELRAALAEKKKSVSREGSMCESKDSPAVAKL
ncbi:hypothetical protein CONPUDRAFT_81461 [Coniophora puteana RWD-64-598 SS2]|uniref:Heme haloperoxidase family profile domain-containing protein n=1 Tax=Coniophora puteana (strain RWD-64-598) TaxID=741705 RepID=A0A5M3MTX2_CONPW|nr:uncharacterized protein CONPUDRAFT_81461 [Coniophora puteana RWD-64-598 SS2]EIW82546.1 hypothetical protein CONPUDRAFT_81461 [Coniophora puteana RWD-64-598 SS2]